MAEVFGPALGLVETRGLIGAIVAADVMVKTALVEIIGIEKTVPALMTVRIRGDVASVRAAVDAGSAAADRLGQLVSSHVIPSPGDGVELIFRGRGSQSPQARRNTIASESNRPRTRVSEKSLEEMTVIELRALARTVSGFPLQGRSIASANKRQLLDAFASHEP